LRIVPYIAACFIALCSNQALLPQTQTAAQNEEKIGGSPAVTRPVTTSTAHVEQVPSHANGKEYSLLVEASKIIYPKGVATWEQPKLYPTRTISQLDGFTSRPVAIDEWGGRLDDSVPATGYFYVKKVGGRWWAIDPEGHFYFHQGLAGIRTGSTTNPGFLAQFKDKTVWMSKTHELLVDNGIHGAGAWSNVDLIRASGQQSSHPIAYTVILDIMSSYGAKRGGLHKVSGHAGYLGNVIFVFDSGFESYVDGYVKEKVATYVKDPALFGYFSDNEMPLTRDNLDRYLALPEKEEGYLAARKWMADHHAQEPTDALRIEFLGYVVDRYASLVSKAMRKYDPHHMYLGCRFNAEALLAPEVFTSMGKYADAISANYYYIRRAPGSWNAWTPDVEQIAAWEQAAQKPIVITEFYAKGADTGLLNKGGGGWLVATQAQRGAYFQNFALALIQSKDVIGWNWFRYQDADPGVEGAKEGVNLGIVNGDYEVYSTLLDSMKQINRNSYALADYFDRRANAVATADEKQ